MYLFWKFSYFAIILSFHLLDHFRHHLLLLTKLPLHSSKSQLFILLITLNLQTKLSIRAYPYPLSIQMKGLKEKSDISIQERKNCIVIDVLLVDGEFIFFPIFIVEDLDVDGVMLALFLESDGESEDGEFTWERETIIWWKMYFSRPSGVFCSIYLLA